MRCDLGLLQERADIGILGSVIWTMTEAEIYRSEENVRCSKHTYPEIESPYEQLSCFPRRTHVIHGDCLLHLLTLILARKAL